MPVFLGFDRVFIVTRSFDLGPKMCRSTACSEASRRKRRTREKKTFGTHGSLKLKKYVSLPTATLSNCQMFSLVDIEETVFNRNKYQSLLSLLLLAPRSGLELNDSVGH